MNKYYCIAFIVLGGLVATGIITLCILDPIMWLGVYEQTKLEPNTVSYQQWLNPSIDIYFEAYFFNLTNPDEFMAGAKAVLRQVGPYTYRERRYKKDLVEDKLKRTVRYREVKEYYFDRQKSAGPEEDLVTTVNLGYLSLNVKFGWMPSLIDKVVEYLENRTDEYLVVRKTVRELLWGYEDPFLVMLNKFGIPVPTTRIGLYLDKNGTDDGEIEIYKDNLDSKNFGHIATYHGKTALTCWTTNEANQINGSDGSLFHPYTKWNEHPYVFSADICRSIQLEPQFMTWVKGLPVIKYLPYTDTFKSPLTTPKNRGFCINWPNCLLDNVHDMSTCLPGAPIVMSLPHFMHADPSYQNAVIGLHPTDDLNTTFYVDPIAGVVMSASKKLQINAIVLRNPKFHELSRLNDTFLPMMFMNESFNVDQHTANSLRMSLIVGPTVVKVLVSLLVVIGGIVLIFLAVKYMRTRHTNGSYEPLPETLPEPSETA